MLVINILNIIALLFSLMFLLTFLVENFEMFFLLKVFKKYTLFFDKK